MTSRHVTAALMKLSVSLEFNLKTENFKIVNSSHVSFVFGFCDRFSTVGATSCAVVATDTVTPRCLMGNRVQKSEARKTNGSIVNESRVDFILNENS